ncbi:hypothetical protein AAAT94_00040, partial [Intestinimonas aquisgranensis]|nr:hypothetical protein [Intestinimonas aquisgranensis]
MIEQCESLLYAVRNTGWFSLKEYHSAFPAKTQAKENRRREVTSRYFVYKAVILNINIHGSAVFFNYMAN